MKKSLFLALTMTFVASIGWSQKVAVVDVEYLLNEMPEYAEAQTELDQKAAAWRQEISQRYDEIKGLYNKYQAEQVLLSESEKTERENEIVEKEKAVRELQTQRFGAEGELYELRRELVSPVQDKLYSAIEDYASQRGYDIILDKGGSVSIIFTNPEYDKTEDIMTKLRAR